MKRRVRINKSDAAESGTVVAETKPTHRLTGISVDEVSIVDRPANQRKFLLIKQQQKAEEVKKETAQTGLEAVDALIAKFGPPPPAAPAAAAPQAPAAAPAPAAPARPQLSVSPEFKAQMLAKLKAAQEKIGAIAQVLQAASEAPGAPVPQELMDALTQIAAMFAPQAPAPAPAAAPPPAAPAPAAAAKEETEKAGRKLSAARIQQLTDARALLDTLLTDVSGTVENETENDAAGDKKDEPAEAKKAAEPAKPSPELVEIKESLTGLATLVGKMTTALEGQNAQISELKKARGSSLQPDTETKVSKAAPVRWSHDMAAPEKNYQ